MKALVKIFFLVLCLPNFILSQEISTPLGNIDNAPFIIKVNAGIPRTISSQMFRKSFTGVYEAGISLNFKLLKNFYMGVGFQRTDLRNVDSLKFKVFNAKLPYNTHLIGGSPYVRLTYNKFYKKNIFVDYSISYGYMLVNYTNVNEDTTSKNKPFVSQNFTSHFIQPEVSANFIIEEHLAFSVMLNYTTVFYKFDPKAPRFNQFDFINKKSNNYYMSWFSLAFGINILIGKRK